MRISILAFIVLAAFAGSARADTVAPAGIGTAGWWVHPCELFDHQVRAGKPLLQADATLAALCQGLFTGVMAVNYIDPPYLPFCEGDNDNTIDYVRTFLAFMRANPGAGDRKLGLVVLVALGRAHPKEQCTH